MPKDNRIGHVNPLLLPGLDRLWCIEARAARAWAWKLNRLERSGWDLGEFYSGDLLEIGVNTPDSLFEKYGVLVSEDGTAIVSISGTLTKELPLSPIGGGVYSELEAVLTTLASDESVSRINLLIDSPGGEFRGTKELADHISVIDRGIKPVEAFVHGGLAASAAYWLATGARSIVTSAASQVGGIGTYAVLIDETGADEKHGIKRVVVNSGGVKGLGADGSISAELIELVRGEIQSAQSFFSEAVAKGRNLEMETVESLATGELFFGDDALERGLIDDVAHGGLFGGLRKNFNQLEVFDMAATKAINTEGNVVEPIQALDDSNKSGAQNLLENEASGQENAARNFSYGSRKRLADAEKQNILERSKEAEKEKVVLALSLEDQLSALEERALQAEKEKAVLAMENEALREENRERNGRLRKEVVNDWLAGWQSKMIGCNVSASDWETLGGFLLSVERHERCHEEQGFQSEDAPSLSAGISALDGVLAGLVGGDFSGELADGRESISTDTGAGGMNLDHVEAQTMARDMLKRHGRKTRTEAETV